MKGWEFIYDKWFATAFGANLNNRLELQFDENKQLLKVESYVDVDFDKQKLEALIKKLQAAHRKMK